MTPSIIIYALLGGILPAVVWLVFWLYEDHRRPEPRGLILRVFIFGMVTVRLVIPFQEKAADFATSMAFAFFLWAILEEVFKFFAAYAGGLITKYDDEPLDPMIYMITAALGFVALENALYIMGALSEGGTASGIITGNMRFIGAGLLHTVSSGVVGIALALSFYKPIHLRVFWGAVGLAVAVLIHTGFNLLLLRGDEMSALVAFAGVWTSIAVLLLFFEKIKTLRKNKPEEIPEEKSPETAMTV